MVLNKRSPRVTWVERVVRSRYPSAAILDVGFVGSYERPFLHLAIRKVAPRAKVVGVDVNLEGVLKHKVPCTLVGDGRFLPFKEASFDVVLFLEVLEHVYCPMAFFTEFWRVLRPGGEVVITTPNAWEPWNFIRNWLFPFAPARRQVYRRYLGSDDHKQFYDPLSLMNLLDDAGFVPVTITTKNHAVPGLRRFLRVFQALDLDFYPLNRLGHYICVIARKAHPPRSGSS